VDVTTPCGEPAARDSECRTPRCRLLLAPHRAFPLSVIDDRDASLPLIVHATTRDMLLAGYRFLVRPVSE
jgi:hypothetical protein